MIPSQKDFYAYGTLREQQPLIKYFYVYGKNTKICYIEEDNFDQVNQSDWYQFTRLSSYINTYLWVSKFAYLIFRDIFYSRSQE